MPKWHWPIDPDEVPRIVVEPPGPKAMEIVRRDEELIMQSFARWYPLVIKRGYGPVVEDVDGNLYIDFNAGIAVTNVGHAHPKVVEAIKRQAELFTHYSLTDFYYEVAVKLAERLVSIAPISGKKKVFFTNSGAESIEGVLKIARGYFKGQRPYVIAFLGAFHGRTYGAMSLTASKPVQRRHFSPLVPGVIHAPFPHPVHCPFKASTPEECGEYALAFLEDWVFKRLVDPSEVSLVIVEPIQGEGGYVVPPKNFIQGLRKLTAEHGILFAVDEVQTGFGRTGRWFAVEHFGVEPDLMATAKAIAAGLPLGAIIGRADVMSLPRGSHANTFGGNPVAAAAALATLEVIEEEDLLRHAESLGEELKKVFREELGEGYDVRGLGLMIGVEMLKKSDLEGVLTRAFKRGVAVIGAGFSTIRIAPPLVIPREMALKAASIIIDVVKS
ncbi:acetyl ornithine aminotransferase family protein [Pyrobaculum calidifontis]|uniref:Ornithine aminotransferase n=1 Tax=Pyrobaculum calidifontis (strain DSM 21063 / JCM 11548 / VA1) TaxID=410359 RepID=A3MTH1_PYRCJ|nr:acetyl ornithine aminotransferase family protein [Pyrobaculum calidifontis]ABO07938.1 4-aminobutyrate aminotransferase apoenzyme [Pyrobaculum calidifontis JCM 11548]